MFFGNKLYIRSSDLNRYFDSLLILVSELENVDCASDCSVCMVILITYLNFHKHDLTYY